MLFMAEHRRSVRADADHRIAGDQRRKRSLVHVVGASRTPREHHVAYLGVGIPHADLDIVRDLETQFMQDAARVDDRTRPDLYHTGGRPRTGYG